MAPSLAPPDQAGGLWSFSVGNSANEWFGPGNPLQPVAQDLSIGRAYDFPTGYNIQIQPKPNEGVTFAELRAIADGYDLLRLVIETRKDQVEKLSWDIKKKGVRIAKKDAGPDARIEKIKDFLAYPDLEHPFGTWIRMLSEDLFVLDAPAVYQRRTRGGGLFALELIDGATIKRILDPTGRTPLDGPAYQQVIKGVPACQYTREELLYMPRNPRTHRAFGFGPVEQVVTTVNIALRRQLHQLSYYTDGNTPNLIFGVPKEWNPDHIKAFQGWWDSLMAGNSQQRQRAMFVPGEVKPIDTKEHALKDDYDEWLARIICFAFSISPTALIKQTNRATAENVQKAALAEGLAPVMMWIKALMDRILRDCFGAADLEFVWSDEQSLEPLVQSQRDQIDVLSGVRTVNECREDRGLEALPDPPPEPVPPAGPVPPGEEPPKVVEPAKPAPPAPAAKLAKAVKKIQPIDRDRKAVAKLEGKIKKTIMAFFKAQVPVIAAALHAAMPATADKMAKMSDAEARELLEASNIDWTELGPDLETVLAAIAQDGVAQGLAQIGYPTTADLLDQVNEKAVTWAEQHAADLVTKLAETTRKSLRGDIAAAIELGMSTEDIADVIGADYGFSEARAELIARTERAFADVKGNLLGYAASGQVEGLRWITANEGDDKVCADCELNDDVVVPMDPETGEATEAFPSGDTVAPGHPDCFVSGTIVSAAGVSKHFKRWFEGEIVRVLIEGHEALTVTPNHPILTQRGWIPAGELLEGDDLFHVTDPGAFVRLCDPENHQVETRIEQIAGALSMSADVATICVPSTPEDFHGDGSTNQDVHIVGTNGRLSPGRQAEGGKVSGDSNFILADSELERFARESTLHQLGHRLDPAANGLVSLGRIGGTDRGGSLGHADAHGLASISNCQSGPHPGLAEGAAVASEHLGQIHAALTSLISTVKVQKLIRGEQWAGHVFNLQTDGGWYLANSIVAHNCRCDLLPVLTDETEE